MRMQCQCYTATPVRGDGAAREQGKALNLGYLVGGGHDLNLLGGGTSLHCDQIFVHCKDGVGVGFPLVVKLQRA
jgi:hypothetical protein